MGWEGTSHLRHSGKRRFSTPTGVNYTDDAAIVACGRTWAELVKRISGESWKSSKTVIDAIRQSKIPLLLDGIHE
jgi:hypothetical protein